MDHHSNFNPHEYNDGTFLEVVKALIECKAKVASFISFLGGCIFAGHYSDMFLSIV